MRTLNKIVCEVLTGAATVFYIAVFAVSLTLMLLVAEFSVAAANVLMVATGGVLGLLVLSRRFRMLCMMVIDKTLDVAGFILGHMGAFGEVIAITAVLLWEIFEKVMTRPWQWIMRDEDYPDLLYWIPRLHFPAHAGRR